MKTKPDSHIPLSPLYLKTIVPHLQCPFSPVLYCVDGNISSVAVETNEHLNMATTPPSHYGAGLCLLFSCINAEIATLINTGAGFMCCTLILIDDKGCGEAIKLEL